MNYKALFGVYNGFGAEKKDGVTAKIFMLLILAEFIICFWFLLDKDKCTNMFISFFTKNSYAQNILGRHENDFSPLFKRPERLHNKLLVIENQKHILVFYFTYRFIMPHGVYKQVLHWKVKTFIYCISYSFILFHK